METPKDDDEKMENIGHFNICVVGAGAVGYIMAHALKGTGKTVMVLDSGINNVPWKKSPIDDRRYWDPIANPLDQGIMERDSFLDRVHRANVNSRDFYTQSRDRCLGGSTNCWGGWIRPLDDYDLSQWPLKPGDINELKSKYFPAALELVGLKNFEKFDKPDDWSSLVSKSIAMWPKDILEKAGLKTVVIQKQNDDKIRGFCDSKIFQDVFTGNIKIRKNSNAIEIPHYFDHKDSKWKVSRLIFQELKDATTPGEKKFLTADHYVLAMGGLEIPRFLMINAVGSAWFGKDSEIGQFYMNHPKYINMAVGWAPLPEKYFSESVKNFFNGVDIKDCPGGSVNTFLVPTETGMKQHGTKNFRYLLDWKPYDGTNKQLNIELNFEQVPHRKSRILLDRNSAPDALGQPRIKLDWQFTEQDQKTVNGSLQMIKSLLQDEDKFNIKFSDWMETTWPDFYKNVYPPADDVTNTQLYTGDHHLGTCAMRAGGYAGVVDSDCRFVGGANLWACSTGVFTTGGWANSTLTLMALALRLADKLKKEP